MPFVDVREEVLKAIDLSGLHIDLLLEIGDFHVVTCIDSIDAELELCDVVLEIFLGLLELADIEFSSLKFLHAGKLVVNSDDFHLVVISAC